MIDEAPDELLVRAADAGPTYLSWTWLLDPFTPHARRLDPDVLGAALDRLDAALPVRLPEETDDEAVLRVMSTGAFTRPESEWELSRALAAAVLPPELVRQLTDRVAQGRAVRVRVTPSPRLARVPWEILVLDDGRRLVEVAEIRYDPPATVHARRSRRPGNWAQVRDLPALHVIDPKPPGHGADSRVLAGRDDERLFLDRLDELADSGAARYDDEEPFVRVHGRVTRQELSKALAAPRSRLLYFGHVASEPDEPGSASLMLSDTVASSWGMVGDVSSRAEDRRPLSALDLLLGTILSGDDTLQAKYAVRQGMRGSDLWPMPARVAVIACEGGADYRAAETFGLVIAMIDAGAELVTTTRWVMPTDTAFRRTLGDEQVCPTTDLALRVDRAHAGDDPIGDLRRWQRDQLARWNDGQGLAYSPLVWAALSHTVAPAR